MKSSKKDSLFHLSLGSRGEMIACGYLLQQGYKILEKNYRCPLGEIDVIAQKDARIIFVEIKTRSHHGFGRPEESVHRFKQKKLLQLAQWYLKAAKKWESPVGFDVLAVTLRDCGDPEIRHIPNAFTVGA